MEVRGKAFPLFFALSFMVFLLFASPVQGEMAATTRVYGRVVDYATHRPIPGAQIVFWNIKRGSLIVSTDASGTYRVNILAGEPYRVYAYFDNRSTPGFDYVPAYRWISPEETEKTSLNISFALLPGASINVVGDLDLFGSPMQVVTFYVVDQYGLLNKSGSVMQYGEPFLINRILGLARSTVIVPANVPIRVMIDIYFTDGTELQNSDGRGGYMNLTRGDRLTVNLRNLALGAVADYVSTRLGSFCTGVKGLVIEAERMGFYVSYERMILLRAENLVTAAYSTLAEGNWEDAYADLHEAYLIITDTEKALQSMYVNAAQSMFFIIPFLGFTAVTTASIFLDGWRRRLAVGLALYGLVLGLLYLFYPGYTIFERTYNPLAGTPYEAVPTLMIQAFLFLAVFSVLYGIPYVFKEKTSMERLRPVSAVAAAFSVAVRNLRRRKLRSLLISISILTSIFAFVALTSFSLESGFHIQLKLGQAPSEGFLLRKSSSDPFMPFEPFDPAVLQWLKERPETALTVPLMVNNPRFPTAARYLLTNPLRAPCAPFFDISGVLGVFPSLEVKVTKMDGIIAKGRFLSDNDLNGILISEEAARSAELRVGERQVEVNDTLWFYDRLFIVVGIFNSWKLGELRDLNGEPLTPQVITSSPLGPPTLERVPSERVLIVHAETARKIGGMVISRVDVQTNKAEDIMDLARLAVLLWPKVEAFASMGGRIHHLLIGPYLVTSGFASATVPMILVILNVGVMMLSAVYERKREVAIMSYVGLNPTHIAAVFTAEALVIGVAAGSLGYLLGLTSYRLMYLLPFTPLVKQKVEATWGILALCLSIGAVVLGSAVPAIKASVIATPSLLRKWKIEKSPQTAGEPWLLRMPIQIQEGELESFFKFMEGQLRYHASYRGPIGVEELKTSKKGGATSLSFTYVDYEYGVNTKNELTPMKDLLANRYNIQLKSQSLRHLIAPSSGKVTPQDEAKIRITATFIRNLILQYSTQKKET